MKSALSKAQREALHWLFDHNGDGMFGRDGVLIAAGERAGVTRSTWSKLRDAGLIEFYKIGDGKAWRVCITGKGRAEAVR